jgi:FAD/FMN-containing dehydrogenase/Fe-S oxidoreductase
MQLSQDFQHELRKRFTGDIRFDLGSKILYSTDASIYQIEPLGVVMPRTVEDLQASVELAAKYHIPILPRGTGSSLAGQSIGEALILDCSRWLDRIIEIDPELKIATVEPGVILSTLNRAASKFGLQFGPDPASAERATMGGVIANNATGAHSILYGMTADHLLSADVIHADGSVATWGVIENRNITIEPNSIYKSILSTILDIRTNYSDAIMINYPRSWRNSAGYRLNYLLPWSPSKPPQWDQENYPPIKAGTLNLAPLLAGSEGTLGVIRRATLNLVPKPKYTILGILNYSSITAACDDVPDLLNYSPSAIELIPQLILRLARSVPEYASQMDWITSTDENREDPSALLVVEFSGYNMDQLIKLISRIGRKVKIIESVEEQAHVWNIRKVGLGILDSRPQSARPIAFIEDCAIPVEQLGKFVSEIEKILSSYGVESGIYAHASAGCLHIRPILDLRTSGGVRYLREIAEQTLTLALNLGGSMSSEHGDGIVRGEWLKKTYGDSITNAMIAIKKAADPDRLLNPQKMFDAPPMDSHLRYGVGYFTRSWSPAMDFEDNGGLVAAIEQCNGQGVCRKDTGVMCPSFQATREEINSTRGRANLLRNLIRFGNGFHNGEVAFNRKDKKELSRTVFESLDLCLACKGCKAECPSGVDMAKLKFAFLAEYYKTHHRLLRDYLFGYFHVTAKLLSSIPQVINFLMNISFIRQLTSRSMRIAPQRPFPIFSTRKSSVKPLPGSQKVLFLRDPFTHYVEPEIEQAAYNVLFAMDFDVILLPTIGAGASLMSKGFLDAARQHAGRLMKEINALDPKKSLPVVGIEPSEIYSLKNDYSSLLPEFRKEFEPRSSKTWVLEEFLVRSTVLNNLRIATKDKKVILQPHCHQKAEGPAADGLPSGANASAEFLRHFGYDVEIIDAGCCGMAGTFGYEAEHYDISQKVGSLKLFPFINNQKMEKHVSATGAACRMQIVQGTGISSEHPVILAEKALKEQLGTNLN